MRKLDNVVTGSESFKTKFDVLVGNSNLPKVLVKSVATQCTKMKTPTEGCHILAELPKVTIFFPIHKTDSF